MTQWPADQVERTFCRFKDWRRLATRFGVAGRQEEDGGAFCRRRRGAWYLFRLW